MEFLIKCHPLPLPWHPLCSDFSMKQSGKCLQEIQRADTPLRTLPLDEKLTLRLAGDFAVSLSKKLHFEMKTQDEKRRFVDGSAYHQDP